MRNAPLLAVILMLAGHAPAFAGGLDAAPAFVPDEDPTLRARSLECMTQAIYYEARNQSDDGQRAVAQVVLNRVRHPDYPGSICGVVFQGSERRTGCQFSFTCDGSMNRRIDQQAWLRAASIAEEAMSGAVYPALDSALNYHTTAIRPYWAPSLVRQAVIGDHIFYRRPDGGSGRLPARQTPRLEYANVLAFEMAGGTRVSFGARGARIASVAPIARRDIQRAP